MTSFQTAFVVFVMAFFSIENGCGTKKVSKKEIPLEYIEWKPVKYEVAKNLGSTEKGFNIEEILPKGYVKDASEDYTAYIQLALNKYDDLVFPGFPLLINDNGLKVKSNATINFLRGSELRLKPSSKANYQILYINQASNVTLLNPVIIGDKDNHKGTKGEWGMGLRISSSKNVKVYNPKISKCWGDGIYISGNVEEGVPEDITIVNAYLKNNRRNGMSIISARGLTVENIYSGFNQGTAPMCGIDIEPNQDGDVIQDITINNAKTEYNGGSAISIGLNRLYGSSDQHVNIQIKSPVDYRSYNGLLVSCSRSWSKNGEKVKGIISIASPLWKYNENESLSIFKLGEPALKVQVSNPSVFVSDGREMTREAFLKVLNEKLSKNASFQLN